MIQEDQTATIAFLKTQMGTGSAPAEIIETHISFVFLTRDRAFKLKRAVKLPYVDFSTAGLRLGACEREVELNRRTAPDLYIGMRRITREAGGGLAFNGTGELVDAMVEMVRFDEEHLFDKMAAAGQLEPAVMSALAMAIAHFHQGAPVLHDGSGSGIMERVLEINEAAFASSHLFPSADLKELNVAFKKALRRHGPLLDVREAAGKVRRCHGDLHLRNVYLAESGPQLFDCIEFNEAIATIDTLYDLAFLLMDLWHRGLPRLANRVMNHYLDATEDEGGLTLLPFFMAIRAAIRAHVLATQVEEAETASKEVAAAACSYLEFAIALLCSSSRPRLYAIGGLSGSGKTTVAEALAPEIAPPPGARIVESDRVRKAMFGVAAETRLGEEAYSPEISAEVYRTLATKARSILSAGGPVVVDAVFDNSARRELIEETASEIAVPFTGVWLDVGAATLRQRVAERIAGTSDATRDILDMQLRCGAGQVEWARIDAGRPIGEIVRDILALPSKLAPK